MKLRNYIRDACGYCGDMIMRVGTMNAGMRVTITEVRDGLKTTNRCVCVITMELRNDLRTTLWTRNFVPFLVIMIRGIAFAVIYSCVAYRNLHVAT